MSLTKEEQDTLKQTVAIATTEGATIKECCESLKVPERSFYRIKKQSGPKKKRGTKSIPHNKLTSKEKKQVVDLLLDPETIDLSPREIYYKKLDEDHVIIASPSTFYRVAKKEGLLTKRSKTGSKRPLNREMPVLTATAPNQVWSWDVSQIQSNLRNKRFYLYVIIDIWSRFVVGHILEDRERSVHAIQMWKDSLENQFITGNGLVNHKDNGAIMTSGEMIKFVEDAQMVDSYSRAGVSDDNPFSEALFRTVKYFRNFPTRFEVIEEGKMYFKKYFNEYNYSCRHSGIQFLTPAERHYGEEEKILNLRNRTITHFYKQNSHRYPGKHKVFSPIKEVGIN